MLAASEGRLREPLRLNVLLHRGTPYLHRASVLLHRARRECVGAPALVGMLAEKIIGHDFSEKAFGLGADARLRKGHTRTARFTAVVPGTMLDLWGGSPKSQL